MSKCKSCGAEIVWGVHPNNPHKMCPFNADGTIHFSTCEAKKQDQDVWDTIDLIPGTCVRGSKAEFVHWWMNKGGGKNLRASCGCGMMHHIRTIPSSKENQELINKKPRKKSQEMNGWGEGFTTHLSQDELCCLGLDEYLPD